MATQNEPLVLDKKENPFAFFCEGESLTKQSFKESCDINVIVPRLLSGADPAQFRARGTPIYADVSQFPDLKTYLGFNDYIQECFSKLDASVRDRFKNDPIQMYEFIIDPKNLDEAVNLGLLEKAKAVAEPSTPPA